MEISKNWILFEIYLFLESKWSHQKDLDDFFIRIYQYHQKHGFFSIILSELFGLMYVKFLLNKIFIFLINRQFVFIVSFTILIVQCIDYPLLFGQTSLARNTTDKIQIHEVIQSPKQCLHK
jgi:autophagy-related protein 9